MRVALAICLLATHAMLVRSAEPDPIDSVFWKPAFESLTASRPPGLAVLLVITDDDPFRSTPTDRARAGNIPSDKKLGTPNLWCAGQLEKAYCRLVESRPEFKEQLTIQGLAAGLPLELTGGEPRNVPSRAVLALCDAQYRLLGIHVGVPHGDEILAIVEDAEDVAISRQLRIDQTSQGGINAPTIQRSLERLDRMWTSVLQGLIRDHAQDAEASTTPIDRVQLISIGETLDAVYLADARRRFGVSGDGNEHRLRLLEQHLETRQPWSDALVALAAGEDFARIWREVVEMVWHQPPISADADMEELLNWVKLHRESDAVVLALEAPVHAQRLPWPPIPDGLSRRAVPWRTTHELAQQHPYREVTAEQLALLIRELPLDPIHLSGHVIPCLLFLFLVHQQNNQGVGLDVGHASSALSTSHHHSHRRLDMRLYAHADLAWVEF